MCDDPIMPSLPPHVCPLYLPGIPGGSKYIGARNSKTINCLQRFGTQLLAKVQGLVQNQSQQFEGYTSGCLSAAGDFQHLDQIKSAQKKWPRYVIATIEPWSRENPAAVRNLWMRQQKWDTIDTLDFKDWGTFNGSIFWRFTFCPGHFFPPTLGTPRRQGLANARFLPTLGTPRG